MRSEELSGDNATTDDTLLEVLNEYKTMGKSSHICVAYILQHLLSHPRN